MLGKMLKDSALFDIIAGVYSWFYGYQLKKYDKAVSTVKTRFDISQFEKGLDVGCGTGALCGVLGDLGIRMTGVDNSKNMLKIARRKHADKNIEFLHHDARLALPFEDKQFDFAIASYVAHGLTAPERKKMILSMQRVSKCCVILHEFNKKRSILTDIVEWLEGGNYFGFIKTIESELAAISDDVEIIDVAKAGSWYIIR